MSAAVPVNARRRDWFRILRDLAAAGWGYSAVGRKCNRDPTTVRMWAEGSEPKESDARVVLALYAKYCPAKYAEHQLEFELRSHVAPPKTIPRKLTMVHDTRQLPLFELDSTIASAPAARRPRLINRTMILAAALCAVLTACGGGDPADDRRSFDPPDCGANADGCK